MEVGGLLGAIVVGGTRAAIDVVGALAPAGAMTEALGEVEVGGVLDVTVAACPRVRADRVVVEARATARPTKSTATPPMIQAQVR